MSCGCKTSGESSHSCGTSQNGCSNVDTCGNSYKLSVFDWLSNVKTSENLKCNYVEVRFKNERKFFYKNVNNLPLSIGSVVAVEANSGHDTGVVSLTGELVKIQMQRKKVAENQALKIYRIANQKDIDTWHEARGKEEHIKTTARKIAENLGLEMKITDVEFQGDGSKVTFYYTAETRVDFRQLIKEYAAVFRTKIDMKQIGFRQEAAKVGGIGSCGRELCCSSWLTDFRSVNTNAARYQQLSINPQKLAGQCGKLKCCLNYELDSYMDALRDFPSSNSTLDTEKGRAFCIKIDVFKKKMWFAYSDSPMAWFDLDIFEVKKLLALNKSGKKTPPLEELQQTEAAPLNTDLIQESSLTRFEKKKNHGKRNAEHKNEHRNSPRPQKNAPKKQTAEQANNAAAAPKNKPANKKFRKPKPDNNAQ